MTFMKKRLECLTSSFISSQNLKNMIFFLSGLAFSWAIVFFFSGPLVLSVVAILTSLILLCFLSLLSLQVLVVYCVIFFVSAVIFWYSNILGNHIGAHFLYFGLISISFSFFKLKHLIHLAISSSIPLCGLVLITHNKYLPFEQIILSESMIYFIKTYAVFSAILIIGMAYYCLLKSSFSSSSISYESTYQKLHTKLSKREVEIAFHLVNGKSYKEISEICFISLATVKSHISNIFQKLNIKKRAEIVSCLLQG